jgi:hypothetical protein
MSKSNENQNLLIQVSKEFTYISKISDFLDIQISNSFMKPLERLTK